MTRFARSRGSRGCNERIPENATPWNIMKKQAEHLAGRDEELEKRQQAELKRKENYDNFLKEIESKKHPESWCEFEDATPLKSDNSTKVNKNSKKQKTTENESTDDSSKKSKSKSESQENTKSELTNNSRNKKKKPTESSKNSESDFDEDDPELVKWCGEGDSDLETKNKYKKLKSQLKAVLKEPKVAKSKIQNVGKPDRTAVETLDRDFQIESIEDEETSSTKKRKAEKLTDPIESVDCDKHSPKRKKKKRKQKQVNDPIESVEHEENSFKNNHNEKQSNNPNENVSKKNRKEKQSTDSEAAISENKKSKNDNRKNFDKPAAKIRNENIQNSEKNKQKNNKRMNGEPYSRRKPLNTEKNIIFVNGEEVEVTTYDGFPILAKEAERLNQLRKSLISKGIARSEVNRTMKLERRKCEKALSRLKKKMCYNCRKGGHNLSECPELSNKPDSVAMPSSGLCFKCGSTEHTHFACKVVKTQEYKFAQCFICNEQGHISRQCPDNPKGLYPRGGGCRECGDVTHLKKDCPKIVELKENDTIRLETLGSSNIEDIKSNSNIGVNNANKSIKHVRF